LFLQLLSKEIKSHITVGSGFRLLSWGGGSGFSNGSDWGGFGDESGWIGQESFRFFRGWEVDIGGSGDGDELFQTVGDRVWGGSHGWVTDLQGSSGNLVDTLHESGSDIVFSDVEYGWVVDGAFVEASLADQTVGKWRNFEHVQKSRFGRTNFVTGFQQVNWGDDFNGTSSNFGLDVQSLKETGLFWTETGILGFDGDIDWGDGAGSSWGSGFVHLDQVSDFFQVTVGEAESNVLDEKWQNFFVLWEFFDESSDDSLHHGVLAHDDGGFSSELSSDVGELEGGNVIGVDQEKFGVVSDGGFELGEVVRFPFLSGGEFFGARHFLYDNFNNNDDTPVSST
jgi:hypothetical protein